MRRIPWSSVLLVAAVLACSGCDGGAGGSPAVNSSDEQVSVKGKVARRGKPLAKIEVKFNAANIKRKTAPTATAVTKEDGSYEVKTLVGENLVTLGGPATAKDPKLQYFTKSLDLKSGDNTVDLDVP